MRPTLACAAALAVAGLAASGLALTAAADGMPGGKPVPAKPHAAKPHHGKPHGGKPHHAPPPAFGGETPVTGFDPYPSEPATPEMAPPPPPLGYAPPPPGAQIDRYGGGRGGMTYQGETWRDGPHGDARGGAYAEGGRHEWREERDAPAYGMIPGAPGGPAGPGGVGSGGAGYAEDGRAYAEMDRDGRRIERRFEFRDGRSESYSHGGQGYSHHEGYAEGGLLPYGHAEGGAYAYEGRAACGDDWYPPARGFSPAPCPLPGAWRDQVVIHKEGVELKPGLLYGAQGGVGAGDWAWGYAPGGYRYIYRGGHGGFSGYSAGGGAWSRSSASSSASAWSSGTVRSGGWGGGHGGKGGKGH